VDKGPLVVLPSDHFALDYVTADKEREREREREGNKIKENRSGIKASRVGIPVGACHNILSDIIRAGQTE
jgi:hypothetical protein